MNVVLVSDDPQQGDALKQELNRQASEIRIETILNSQSAFPYLNTPSACDAILLDSSVSLTDAVNLVSAIRLTKTSTGIVALVETEADDLPAELIRAGVDKLVKQRPEDILLLEEALISATERHRSGSGSNARQVRIIYAGDVQAIQPHISDHPHWILERASFGPDGLLSLPETLSSQDEIIVIDGAVEGKPILKIIRDIRLRTPDTPIILLTDPEDEEIPILAMNAGVSDCVDKKEGYIQRLLPAVDREVKRRQILREKAALQSREESLRQVIETMPAGVTVISPDGTFLAINHAGLKLLGAGRLDQIIGKNIVRLLPSEQRDTVISFLATISQGTEASLQLDWRGLDGTSSKTELRAVPMRRDPAGTVVALAVVAPLADEQTDQRRLDDARKEIETLKDSLRESETRYRELQDKVALKPADWEEELRKAQSAQSAAEEQLAILKKTAEETEVRYTDLLEEQRAERASWEQARNSYREQCAKIENMAQTLRTAQETLLETHDAERGEWESRLHELEQKKKDVEDQLARISEESHRERSQWDAAREESEQKLRDAEQQRSMLDSILQEAQSGLVQLGEHFSAEKSKWDLARRELEHKLQSAEEQRSALDHALRETQSKIIQLEETLGNERSEWDSARQQMEQTLQATEKKHSAELQRVLNEAESRIAAARKESQEQSARLNDSLQEIEQLKAEMEKLTAELTKSHLRNHRLSQISAVGFVMATSDGQVLECNDAAARMFGYSGAEEALDASGDDAFRIYAFKGGLAKRLQQERRLDLVEWSSLGRDGRLVRLQENARLVERAAGESTLVERVLTDITRIHPLSEELRRTRRLESTGDLAAATVKSLNSLCTTLEDCGKLLQETPDDEDAVRKAAETLLNKARRGMKYSHQFFTIAGKADRTPDLLNLNEILSGNDSLLRSLAGENIDLQIILPPPGGMITADQQDLIQLISTLVADSREALPLGGTITIETANSDRDIPSAGLYPAAQAGAYVQMTVSADGCVIHPERRIASNKIIVERLGGWMETTHNAEDGNLHQIYLPRIEPFGGQVKS